MAISPKNAEKALKAVGLDQPGPILASVKDAKIVEAARYAEFLDRMDRLDSADLTDLPNPSTFNPTILK